MVPQAVHWTYQARTDGPHTGTVIRMAGKPKTKLPPLSLTGATAEVVKKDVLDARRPRRNGAARERSKDQKILDALVSKAYAAWVKAGKPEKFWESPGGHIRVREDQLVQVQRAIHSSGRLLDLKIRFGEIIQEDGYADVVFSAADRPVKQAGAVKTETA